MKPYNILNYMVIFIISINSYVNSGTIEEKKFDFGIAPGILFGGFSRIIRSDSYYR